MSSAYLEEDVVSVEFPTLGILSTWFGVGLIAITAIGHIFVADEDLLWAEPIWASLKFVLVALILASLLYLALRSNHTVKVAALPLLINIGTLIIVHFVPFAALWQEFNFYWYFSSYKEAVNLVETGTLQPTDHGFAILPASLAHLSANNGTVMIDKREAATMAFFFTKRRTGQNFAGYMYRSDNNPPQVGDFGGRWWFVTPKRPHWFFCASF